MGGLDMARHAWQPVHDHDQDQDKEHDKEQDKPQDKLAHRRRAVLVVSLVLVVFLAASLVAALATTTSLSCLWAGDCSTSHSRNMTEVLGSPVTSPPTVVTPRCVAVSTSRPRPRATASGPPG